MTLEKAKQFTEAWLKAWNEHDINLILDHYSDNIEFHSPLIKALNFNNSGVIKSKEELKNYFSIGLNAYPNLQFKLHNVYAGVDTLVIAYTSVNDRLSSEVFHLNESNKAIKVFCNYTS